MKEEKKEKLQNYINNTLALLPSEENQAKNVQEEVGKRMGLEKKDDDLEKEISKDVKTSEEPKEKVRFEFNQDSTLKLILELQNEILLYIKNCLK